MPGPEWIWVILVIVVVFGASRLPIMGRNVGLGIKEFKKGIAEAEAEPPAKALSEEKVTMTKAELDAMLAEREAQARKDAPPAV
jgi:sec-independent protein translocase protein TatA